MQSAPDLATTSLDAEIKKADTPARMAALRETEQARLELQAGHTDEAMRDLGRAVSIDPGNPFEYFYLGRAYIARRNYHQALTFLERAEIGFAARPDWLGADVGLEGDCYEELGQNTDAVLAYQRALGTAPNNLTARVGYSRLASYLPAPPSPPSVDPSIDPASADEVSPPPRADVTEPAPSEPPPPPPPVSNVQQSAPKEVVPAGSSPD
jgi:tetratricopeptide (TPR) repeat protein